MKVDIRALAQLARVDISNEEVERLEKEIPSILDFVETIQKADISNVTMDRALRNVMRPDENPHESGEYSKKLLDAAPATEKDQVKVMQVLRQK